jgi:uncharacterized protein (DUF4415 family)
MPGKGDFMNNISKTDWKKIDSKSDEELTQNAISDPDNPPIDEEFFDHAKRVDSPQRKQQITLRIDSDTLDWFKKQGKGYQTMINAVLRAYKDSRQDSSKTGCG